MRSFQGFLARPKKPSLPFSNTSYSRFTTLASSCVAASAKASSRESALTSIALRDLSCSSRASMSFLMTSRATIAYMIPFRKFVSLALRRKFAFVCSWLMRDSLTSKTWPISLKVKSSW